MIRELELAFIKLHFLYHASKEEVFGIGLINELARHGYTIGPGTLYPTLAKMEKQGLLSVASRTVQHKQRKYYRITPQGRSLLEQMKYKIEELYIEIIKER